MDADTAREAPRESSRAASHADHPARAARLHRLAVEFNLRLDRYIDPSWLPLDWPAPYRDFTAFGVRGRALLARHLLAQSGLADRYAFGFGTLVSRIALIERSALTTLAAYCGLMLHRAWLQEAPNWRTHSALVDAFGYNAMPFVLDRAPPFDAIGESLEPFRQTPRAAVDAIRQRGARLLLDFVAPEGDAIIERMRLKFARGVSEQPAYGLSPVHRQHLAELIFLCLIPERLVQWDWLF
jgi:type III secretion protein K